MTIGRTVNDGNGGTLAKPLVDPDDTGASGSGFAGAPVSVTSLPGNASVVGCPSAFSKETLSDVIDVTRSPFQLSPTLRNTLSSLAAFSTVAVVTPSIVFTPVSDH